MTNTTIEGTIFRSEGGYRHAVANGELDVVDQIEVGEGNEGVYVLEYSRRSCGMDATEPRQKQLMVKKCSTSDLEFTFCQWLCAEDIPAAKIIFPEIYDCLELDGKRVILLEYLPQAGTKSPFELRVAEALADWVLLLNGLGTKKAAPEFISRKCNVVNRKLSERNISWIVRNSKKELAEDFFSDDAPMRDYLKGAIEGVLSHGDLGFPNVFIPDDADSLQLKVFDFSHVRFMTPGAEFHHFARHSTKGGDYKEFFNRVTKRYATKGKKNVDMVRLGAYLYAMDRQLGRTTRRLKGISDKKLQNDISIIVSLYRKAQNCYARLLERSRIPSE